MQQERIKISAKERKRLEVLHDSTSRFCRIASRICYSYRLRQDADSNDSELFPGHFKNLHLFIPDPYDLVLSKRCRNIERDRKDVAFLADTRHLDPDVARERYKQLIANWIGPQNRHDATLKFWARAYFAKAHK